VPIRLEQPDQRPEDRDVRGIRDVDPDARAKTLTLFVGVQRGAVSILNARNCLLDKPMGRAFEDAIAAALEAPPEPGMEKPFGKSTRPQPDRSVRSREK